MIIHSKEICLISFYHDLDYVRIKKSAQIIENLQPSQLHEIKVQKQGIGSYITLFIKLIQFRFSTSVDYYYLNFRGTEIFYPVRFITLGKKLIYDSFVPFYQAFKKDNKWGLPSIFRMLFGWMIYIYELGTLRLSHRVITDTQSHADMLSKQYGLSSTKLIPVYVGANDHIFQQRQSHHSSAGNKLTILYYGNFLPLHGLQYLFDSLELIERPEDFKFVIIGKVKGVENTLADVRAASPALDVEYIPRLPLVELRDKIADADVCIAGPLGNTAQAQNVITGKAFQFMAMGIPMIIGRNKETDRFNFNHGDNCLIVNQGSSEDLAAILNWLSSNREVLLEMGRKARELYEQNYSTAILSQQMKKAFA